MDRPGNIIEFFSQMLARREYFIPLISAQYQFPNHYYGLTSAALLEDLFVDAAINFKNQEHHNLQLERPERVNENNLTTDSKGQKGWDYRYEGQNFSHKVGGKVQGIALLWDATFELPPDNSYSYPSPIVMVLSNYKNKNANLVYESDKKVQITSISNYRNKEVKQGQQILFVQRNDEGSWKLLEIIDVNIAERTLNQVLDLSTVWNKMMGWWASGSKANGIEIFITKASRNKLLLKHISESVEIDFEALPGVYLFPKELLQNVKVKKNNRAILLPTEKVQELMDEASRHKNFTYLPNWFTCYATNRSVDLYLVQRVEYDRLNSAARS